MNNVQIWQLLGILKDTQPVILIKRVALLVLSAWPLLLSNTLFCLAVVAVFLNIFVAPSH